MVAQRRKNVSKVTRLPGASLVKSGGRRSKRSGPAGRPAEPERRRSAALLLSRSTFSPEVARTFDRIFNAGIANYTLGLDPRIFALTALDWSVKLAW